MTALSDLTDRAEDKLWDEFNDMAKGLERKFTAKDRANLKELFRGLAFTAACHSLGFETSPLVPSALARAAQYASGKNYSAGVATYVEKSAWACVKRMAGWLTEIGFSAGAAWATRWIEEHRK